LVLWSRTLELIDRMGCGATFVDAGFKMRAANIIAGGRQIAHINLAALETPHPCGLVAGVRKNAPGAPGNQWLTGGQCPRDAARGHQGDISRRAGARSAKRSDHRDSKNPVIPWSSSGRRTLEDEQEGCARRSELAGGRPRA
jgi:hypothetical protein